MSKSKNNKSKRGKNSKSIFSNVKSKEESDQLFAKGTPKVLKKKELQNNTDKTIEEQEKTSNTQKEDKSKFDDTPTATVKASYTDIIDFLSVSETTGGKPGTVYDQLSDYIIMVLKYSFLVIILTLNFIGLSTALNCNADQEFFKRIASGVFAFFFGFVYLLINYYTFKVMVQGKICKFNRDKLFPFSV
jgi:hypothetical protein